MLNRVSFVKLLSGVSDFFDKELSEITIYNDEGKSKKEFEERGNKLLDDAKDLLKKL